MQYKFKVGDMVIVSWPADPPSLCRLITKSPYHSAWSTTSKGGTPAWNIHDYGEDPDDELFEAYDIPEDWMHLAPSQLLANECKHENIKRKT